MYAIRAESGHPDVFVHISAVELAGYKTLEANQSVSFEVQTRDGQFSAVNLHVAS